MQKDIVPEFIKATTPGLLAFDVAQRLVEEFVGDVQANKSFYRDFIKFNFGGNSGRGRERKVVSVGDLPVQAKKQISRLRRKVCGLGSDVPSTSITRLSKAEAKWVYLYYKKYGSVEYVPGRGVSDREMMTYLSASQVSECKQLF